MSGQPIDEPTLALVQDLIEQATRLRVGTLHLTIEVQLPVHNGRVVGDEVVALPKVRLSDVPPKRNLVSSAHTP